MLNSGSGLSSNPLLFSDEGWFALKKKEFCPSRETCLRNAIQYVNSSDFSNDVIGGPVLKMRLSCAIK